MEGSLLPDGRGDAESANTMTFKGSAIRGSSLLNTFNDIRPHIQRGATLLIDGVTYETATTGEWNSYSVQLTSDYEGETNFSVNIVLPSSSLSPKRKKVNPTKKSKPVSQEKNQPMPIQKDQDMGNNQQTNSAVNPSKPQRPTPHNKRSHRQNIVDVSENNDDSNAPSNNHTHATAELSRNRVEKKDTVSKRPNPSVRRVSNTNVDVEQEGQSTNDNSSQNRPKSRTSIPSARQVKPRVKRASAVADEEGTAPAHPAVAPVRRGSFTPARPAQHKVPITQHQSPSHTVNDETETESKQQSLVTEATLLERRKAAAERVKRKLKEDQERVDKAAAEKEAELRALKEASELKARELQARTAKRVEQYKEECLRKEHHAKAVAQYEQQERERINQEFLSAARFQKMKEIRKEAKQRLNQVAQGEYRQAVREAEERQKQLSERHKKYDVNTTFLPKLDGGASQASSQRRNGQTATPPGRVVKNLGRELAQLEADSASFPEEPVLRSRSARQVARGKQVHHQQQQPAPKKQHQEQVVHSARKDGSLPVLSARGGSAKQSSILARPPKDEDEWSDDEPDALLLGKDSYLRPATLPTAAGQSTQNNDGNYLEEDSLDMGGNEEYGRLDDEMEMELFGELQGSGHIKSTNKQVVAVPKPTQHPIFVSPTAKNLSQQQGKNRYPPQRGVDETASDCSELTDDSILNRMDTKKTKTSAAATKKNATATQQQMQRTAQRTPPALGGSRLPRPSDRSAPTMPPLAQLPMHSPAPMQQHQQDQVMFKSSYNYAQVQQQQQPQVLIQHAPPPLPANTPQAASHNSNNSSSPSKSKSSSRPMFRKLKPIPISVPYRHVPTSNM